MPTLDQVTNKLISEWNKFKESVLVTIGPERVMLIRQSENTPWLEQFVGINGVVLGEVWIEWPGLTSAEYKVQFKARYFQQGSKIMADISDEGKEALKEERLEEARKRAAVQQLPRHFEQDIRGMQEQAIQQSEEAKGITDPGYPEVPNHGSLEPIAQATPVDFMDVVISHTCHCKRLKGLSGWYVYHPVKRELFIGIIVQLATGGEVVAIAPGASTANVVPTVERAIENLIELDKIQSKVGSGG